LLGTAYVIARNNGKEKVVHYLKFGTLNKKRFQMWRLLIGMPFPHSSVMYSRNALKQIQGFPRNITSSIDFFSLIKIANTCDIYGLNKVLVERNLDNKNFFMTKEMTMRNEINMKNINLWCNKNINFYTILVLPRKIREILLKIKVFR
jgi:hypothetical protein